MYGLIFARSISRSSESVGSSSPSTDLVICAFCSIISFSIFSRTYSNALIKKPPLPQHGSHITSPSCGSSNSTMKLTMGRGVKNCPNSPRKVFPKNFSKAIPFTSSEVVERLYFCNSFTIASKLVCLILMVSLGSNKSSFSNSAFVSSYQ